MFTVLHTSPLWGWSVAGLIWSYLLAGGSAILSTLILGARGQGSSFNGDSYFIGKGDGAPLLQALARVVALLAPVPLLLVSDLPVWTIAIVATVLYAGQTWLTYDYLRGVARGNRYELSFKHTGIIWLIAANTAICVSILAFAG